MQASVKGAMSVTLVGASAPAEVSADVCRPGNGHLGTDNTPHGDGFDYASFFETLTVDEKSSLNFMVQPRGGGGPITKSDRLMKRIVLRTPDGLRYVYEKNFGAGTFGEVVKLRLVDAFGGAVYTSRVPRAIALKLYSGNPFDTGNTNLKTWLDELRVVNSMNNQDAGRLSRFLGAPGKCGDRVPARVITHNRVSAVIMRAANDGVNKIPAIEDEHAAFGLLQAMYLELRCVYRRYGFLHCDVKTENFLYACEEGTLRVMLADYGGCQIEQQREVRTGGTAVGTYMPPWLIVTPSKARAQAATTGGGAAPESAPESDIIEPYATVSNVLSQFAAVLLHLMRVQTPYGSDETLVWTSTEAHAIDMLDAIMRDDCSPTLSAPAKEFLAYCLRYDVAGRRFLEHTRAGERNNLNWDEPLTWAGFESALEKCLPPPSRRARAWAALTATVKSLIGLA